MYCPTCGVDSVEGLKYCKRCGANITGTFSAPPKKFPLALTIAFLIIIGGTFIVGLALPMAASRDLMAAGFSTGQLMDPFLADMGVTLVVVVLLIWLFLRLIKLYQQTGSAMGSHKRYPTSSRRSKSLRRLNRLEASLRIPPGRSRCASLTARRSIPI